METWRQAIDTALKKQLRTYVLTYSQESEETNWAGMGGLNESVPHSLRFRSVALFEEPC